MGGLLTVYSFEYVGSGGLPTCVDVWDVSYSSAVQRFKMLQPGVEGAVARYAVLTIDGGVVVVRREVTY